MVNSVTTEDNITPMVDLNSCITANVIYVELSGIRFMVDLAILRLFPESILITMFPTGIPLVNIKQQYKSLARLQQFFLKLIKLNIQTIENYSFEMEDFTDENEVFVNPNLSPMDEVFILYINFEPYLFEYLYRYFSVKFTKMQYLKFREQYEEGEAQNIDMEDIQQIKNLFYITISQQIILVLREEIEFFVIPSVNLESNENRVEQTNSIVQLYNKDLCNLEFMQQLKNVCSQFLVDRKNVLVKLDNIKEFEDITKAHIFLEEYAKQNQEEKSSVVSLSNSLYKKQKRNYAILNTLNILTKIQGDSTWGYRARETNKSKINSIVMLLVNLPLDSLNPDYEYELEEEEEIEGGEGQYLQQQIQQIPEQGYPNLDQQQLQQQQLQQQQLQQQQLQQQMQMSSELAVATQSEESYNNKNNNTNNSINNPTTDSSHRILESTILEEDENEMENEVVDDQEKNSKTDSSYLDADEDDDAIIIPPRPSLPLMDHNNNNRSFVVINDMGDTSFNSAESSRILHHSNSSNNIRSNSYSPGKTELFESHTDIYDTSSNIFRSCTDVNSSSRHSIPFNDSHAILYHSCVDVDGSKIDTESMDSLDNETRLDIDNIDNIENKLEEIHMKCSDENSVILHNSIREIVRSSSKDEENLQIISYIQDEVSDTPHNSESLNINSTSISASNTTVTTDIIGSSPLAQSENEIINTYVVPSNDKPVSPSSVIANFDDNPNDNINNSEPEINDINSNNNNSNHSSNNNINTINNINSNNNNNDSNNNISPPNVIYNACDDTEQSSEANITDTSYSTTDEMTNEIVVPDLSNMVTQVEPEQNYNQEAMNNTLSILQPCRNFWWESIALHLELPKDKYQINESLKFDYNDINFSNIKTDEIKEQNYNIDDTEASLSFIDLKLWLRRQWTVEFCAV